MTKRTTGAPSWLYEWLKRLAHAIYSVRSHLNEPVDETLFSTHLSGQWRTMPIHMKGGCILIAFSIEWLSLLRFGRPFSHLDSTRQLSWIRAWAESRHPAFRLSMRLVITLIKPSYFQQPKVQKALRYSRPIHRQRLAHSGTAPHIETTKLDKRRRHQVVVVGTGAGGAVIGAELAQAGFDVAFIESGRLHSAESFRSSPLDSLKRTYRNGGLSIAYGRPNIPLPQGETVGGSTTINSGTCFRMPDAVSRTFERLSIGLNTTNLAPHYDAIEKRLSVQTVDTHLLGGSSRVIARGAEKLQLRHGPLRRNIRGCVRSGQCAFGCPKNAKQAMHLTFLPDALGHGATLYDGLEATRIRFVGDTAVGIDVVSRDDGTRHRVDAEIIVSACGTIRTVPLLKRSGLTNRHLGRHLSIHPASKITALMPEPIAGWNDTPQGYGIFDLMNDGILFEGAYVPPEYGVVSLPFIGEELERIMSNYDRLAIFGLFVADGPNGRVHVLPNGDPMVSYWLSKRDAERFNQGLRLLAKVFFAAGANEIFLPLSGREHHLNLETALKSLQVPINPWDLELVAFHPLGTARMSSQPSLGVVDPRGMVWGRKNLYVADGSIFPASLGVNPQLTIMAAAKHIATQIIARY